MSFFCVWPERGASQTEGFVDCYDALQVPIGVRYHSREPVGIDLSIQLARFLLRIINHPLHKLLWALPRRKSQIPVNAMSETT